MKNIHGVVPIIPIPFHDDESIDENSLRQTIDWVASMNLAGIALPAYGSEFYKMSDAEREQVVAIAIDVSRRRLPVIAQANHGSSRLAAATAKHYEQMGADLISFAIPRQFGTTHDDLLDGCGRICDAVSVPVLIQDFNPGGATIQPDFISDLSGRHENFKYVKLEEPMLLPKLKAIKDRVGDRVGILEGWGGYYMLEGIPAGICGIMPGVPIADLLDRVFQAQVNGDSQRAYDLMGALLPWINFTLQDLELFHQVEKRLLVRRGLFARPTVRSITLTPGPEILDYSAFLIDQIMRILKREGLAS